MQNFKSFLDFSAAGQYLFQDSATPMMNGIVELHHYIMSFLIFILIFVSGSLFTIVYMCVYLVRMFPKRPLKKIDRIYFNSNWRPSYCVSLLRRRFLSKPRFVRFSFFSQVDEFTTMASYVQTMFRGYFKRYRIPVRHTFLSGRGFSMYNRVLVFDVFQKRGLTKIRFAIKRNEAIRYLTHYKINRYTWEKLLKFVESYSLGLFHYYRLFYTSRSYVQRFNHNTLLEVVWTTLPTFVLLFIGAPSFVLLYAMDEIIEPSVVIKCLGHQWYWSYEIDVPLKQATNLCDPSDHIPVDHDNIFTIGQILDFELLTLAAWDELYQTIKHMQTTFQISDIGHYANWAQCYRMKGISSVDLEEEEHFFNKLDSNSFYKPTTFDDLGYWYPIHADVTEAYPTFPYFHNSDKNIRVAEFALFLLIDKCSISKKIPELLDTFSINEIPFEDTAADLVSFVNRTDWSKSPLSAMGVALQMLIGGMDLSCLIFSLDLPNVIDVEFEKSRPSFMFERMADFIDYRSEADIPDKQMRGIFIIKGNAIINGVVPCNDRFGEILIELHNNACKIVYAISNISEPNKHLYSKFDSYMISEDNLEVGSPRLLEVDNALIIPVQTHIDLLISSSDVLHSWSVPSFGIKMDACPGRLNHANLFVEREGVFYGQCSEICGVEHGFMPIKVLAVPAAQFATQFIQ